MPSLHAKESGYFLQFAPIKTVIDYAGKGEWNGEGTPYAHQTPLEIDTEKPT